MKIRPSTPEFLRRSRTKTEDDSSVGHRDDAESKVPSRSSTINLQRTDGDEPDPHASQSIAAPASEGDTQEARLDTDDLVAEAALVEIARQDPHAFAGLYEQNVDRIYAYIYHRVGNTHDAEDLTARTFYRALDRLDQYEDRGLPFSAWLFRIAHNLVANWHRDRQRRRFLSFDRLWGHGHEGDTPETQVEREARHAALWSAIDRLPEERRNLLLLKFGGQLTNVEIGEALDKSESAIKSLYFRTLASLRKDLEARGWGIESPETGAEDLQGDDGDGRASDGDETNERPNEAAAGRTGAGSPTDDISHNGSRSGDSSLLHDEDDETVVETEIERAGR